MKLTSLLLACGVLASAAACRDRDELPIASGKAIDEPDDRTDAEARLNRMDESVAALEADYRAQSAGLLPATRAGLDRLFAGIAEAHGAAQRHTTDEALDLLEHRADVAADALEVAGVRLGVVAERADLRDTIPLDLLDD